MAQCKGELQIGFFARVQVLLAVGAALCAGGFYLAIYLPQAELSRQLTARILAQQQELNIETATARNLPAVERQVTGLIARLQGLKHVPDQPDIGEFVRVINQLSQESSLTKMDVQPGTARQSALYDERPVKLTFQGDFSGVYEFLQGIEGLKRLTRIQSVKLLGITGKPGQVSAEVSICIYYHDT
jgi:Tfp pilus assembly protein PilO